MSKIQKKMELIFYYTDVRLNNNTIQINTYKMFKTSHFVFANVVKQSYNIKVFNEIASVVPPLQ